MSKQHELAFRVPADLTFSDLCLRWGVNGEILFEWSAIERLCAASGLDVDIFKRTAPENVARLINTWYTIHLRSGGAADLVKEEAESYSPDFTWASMIPMQPSRLSICQAQVKKPTE